MNTTTKKLQNRLTRLAMLPMSRNIERKMTRTYRLMGEVRHREILAKREERREVLIKSFLIA
jgi:hypothetical protein